MKKKEVYKMPHAELCKDHKPVELSYFEWNEYAEKNHKNNIKQSQCPKCGYWLFPDEL